MSTDTGAVERFVRLPTVTSSVVAVVAAGGAVGLLADTAIQRRLLAAVFVGVAAVGVGGRLRTHFGRPIGLAIAVVGSLVVALGVWATLVAPSQFGHRLELVPGLVGLWVLVVALVPIRAAWSRRLIDLGTGLVFAGVLVSGVLRDASTTALLLAAAATILAWDAADNAVSLGNQIGAHWATKQTRAELHHIGITGAVAVVAVVTVSGIDRLGVAGLPFAALFALVVAGVLFALVATE
jgi:hypothetical protein